MFDVVSKGSLTSEKTFTLNIAATREGVREKVISDVGFVRTSNNLAGGLTKSMFQATLRHDLYTGLFEARIERWIMSELHILYSSTPYNEFSL